MTSSMSGRWIRPAILNLNIVALIGIVLRYKIAFSLPFLDQKHLLHSHSNFAFGGWISQAIMVLIVEYLFRNGQTGVYRKYSVLFLLNLISAYGMLAGFTYEGYGPFSISSSTLSILTSWVFGVMIWRDLRKLDAPGLPAMWFRSAVVFGILSSAGAFSLTYMMVNRVLEETWYLASIYFYLHFQYNGWFFFACMGFLTDFLLRNGMNSRDLKPVFYLFVCAAVPAYFLSALWLPMPDWLYGMVVAAAVVQVIAWAILLIRIKNSGYPIRRAFSGTAGWVAGLAGLACSVKIILQLGSVYPPLSKLAFGFRPIVVGYLHLVLLGVITLFLLAYLIREGLLNLNRFSKTGLWIFITGVFLNEMILMIQGMSALRYESIPGTNEMLLIIALLMFTGLLFINLSNLRKRPVSGEADQI